MTTKQNESSWWHQHASRQGGNQPLYTKEQWEARRKARAEAKAQQPATPPQDSLKYTDHVKNVSSVSGFVPNHEYDKIVQERDEARAEVTRLEGEAIRQWNLADQARAQVAELEAFKAEAVKTSERQLVAFQTERAVVMQKNTEIKQARAQVADLLAALRKIELVVSGGDGNNLPPCKQLDKIAGIARAEKGQS